MAAPAMMRSKYDVRLSAGTICAGGTLGILIPPSVMLVVMAFREIEELTATYPIELIGDRRTLTLGETFCRPGAAQTVAHELQRLIIEVAEANPHAR